MLYARGITPGYGYAHLMTLGRGYRYGHNVCIPTRNFCEFCKTCIPVPGTFVSSVRLSYPHPSVCSVNSERPRRNTRGTGMPLSNTRVRVRIRVQHSCTSAEILEFYETFILAPGTPVSCVRFPYPYAKHRNPTEHLVFSPPRLDVGLAILIMRFYCKELLPNSVP